MVITQDSIQRHTQVPCGNFHHKQTSPTTNDQPSYHPKLMKAINQACLSRSKQPCAFNYLSENDLRKPNLTPMVLCNLSKIQK